MFCCCVSIIYICLIHRLYILIKNYDDEIYDEEDQFLISIFSFTNYFLYLYYYYQLIISYLLVLLILISLCSLSLLYRFAWFFFFLSKVQVSHNNKNSQFFICFSISAYIQLYIALFHHSHFFSSIFSLSLLILNRFKLA